jgi:hypothetical protein
MKRTFFILFIFYLAIGSCHGQVFQKRASGNAEKELFIKPSSRKKESKIKEPRSVVQAKKKQAENKRKIDKAKKKYIKWSQKRARDIQTPEVKARMKIDRKDSVARDREKRKNSKADAGKVRKKYK